MRFETTNTMAETAVRELANGDEVYARQLRSSWLQMETFPGTKQHIAIVRDVRAVAIVAQLLEFRKQAMAILEGRVECWPCTFKCFQPNGVPTEYCVMHKCYTPCQTKILQDFLTTAGSTVMANERERWIKAGIGEETNANS
jgi:hypothetical protein